jgi:hypothetical protein
VPVDLSREIPQQQALVPVAAECSREDAQRGCGPLTALLECQLEGSRGQAEHNRQHIGPAAQRADRLPDHFLDDKRALVRRLPPIFGWT